MRPTVFAILLLTLITPTDAKAQDLVATSEFAPNRVIVRVDEGSDAVLEGIVASIGAEGHRRLFGDFLWLIHLPKQSDVRQVASELESLEAVSYAHPDMIVQTTGVPNDPGFSQQWGFNQPNDADIDAPEGWDVYVDASTLVVAVLDTGTQWDHPDLQANIWTNPGEIPANGIDDDNNGYVDDVHGYDWVNDDGNPDDDNGHGTHTAGTIGAVTDNGIGVAGVCWNVQIMPLKFLGAGGGGLISHGILAIEYSMNNGADLSSNSWGCYCGSNDAQAMEDAIDAAWQSQGMLFVAAAGNASSNNDTNPFYPASITHQAVLSVAATDEQDDLAGFSNWGRLSVDIGAPGNNVYSTWIGDGYASISGTSMACPHVAGAVALYKSYCPQRDFLNIKTKLMETVDILPSLQQKVASNGRLNLRAALDSCPCAVRFRNTGQGLAGSGGFVPELIGQAGSCDANAYSIEFSNGLGGALGVLWMGIDKRDQSLFGGHFYVDLSSAWFSFPIQLQGSPGVPGAGFLSVPGVDVGQYIGLILHSQGTFLDPAAIQGVSMTRELTTTVD